MQYVEKFLQSLHPIYNQAWVPYALGVVGIIVGYSILMSLKSLPKLVMYPIIMSASVIVFINWIYNRNEPELLTPIVEFIAPWLPGKGS